jgi:hypothetical protein
MVQGYFLNQESTDEANDNGTYDPDRAFQEKHKMQSKWIPQKAQVLPLIHNFAEEVYNTLKNLPFNKRRKSHNLSTPQQKALNRLRKCKHLIFKAADKGSGICVLTPQQYTDEAMKQLNNPTNYMALDSNPIPDIQRRINSTIEKHVYTGAIPKKTANILPTPKAQPAKFYLLPKVHKNINNPPGRPIMAGNSNPTERISEYVDYHLKPHLNQIPSYIKDTNHFLEICRNLELPPDAKLVTLDVSSLYTNILHKDGIYAIGEFMSKFSDVKTTNMIKDLTQLILNSNVFEFDGQLYIQLQGTAMGSKFAPSYASIYMHFFETTHLPNAPVKPLLWKRFIDDVFAIFTCSDKELENFMQWINGVHSSIKFTSYSNSAGVPFLDTFATIKNGKIITKPFTKETDTKQYILPTSCHPQHIIKSIPYSQALRIERICTEFDTLKAELANLSGFFINRQYEPALVEQAINRVLEIRSKKDGVKTTIKERASPSEAAPTEKKLPLTALVVPFHPCNPRFQETINEIWMKYGKTALNTLIRKPIVALTRPKNLKDTLTRARYGPPAIEKEGSPTQHLIKRPITTFDNDQLKAPIKHSLFTCPMHEELNPKSDSLTEAIESSEFMKFCQNHYECGKLNIIPVEVQQKITLKCTECSFKQFLHTTKRSERINKEILNACETTRKALLRKQPIHTACNNTCKTCKLLLQEDNIVDRRGTRYRLADFNCTAKNAIYVIKCKLCNLVYVGLTTTSLKQRMLNHLSSIRNWKTTSIALHFNDGKHKVEEDFRIGILDHNVMLNEDLRIREGVWIGLLDSVNNGINQRNELSISIDYQVFTYFKHYNHSATCLPYILSQMEEVRTLDLKTYRINRLDPKHKKHRVRTRDATEDQRQTAAR